MSSKTIVDSNEQAPQTTIHRDGSSTVTSTSTSTLATRIRTENDDEDNLTERIDELIRHFLSRPNRRSPYRSFFRWTFDNHNDANAHSKLSYSVVLNINASSSERFR